MSGADQRYYVLRGDLHTWTLERGRPSIAEIGYPSKIAALEAHLIEMNRDLAQVRAERKRLVAAIRRERNRAREAYPA